MAELRAQVVIKRQSRELSNTRRELQLSEEVNKELEKTRVISSQVLLISNRLLFEITDLTDSQINDLHKQMSDSKDLLKKSENRLKTLRRVQNGCQLNVKMLSSKRTKNNRVVVNGQEFTVYGGDDEDVVAEREDDDQTIEDIDDHKDDDYDRSRESSATDVETNQSSVWSEAELNSSRKQSGRQRVIPERFESFPARKRSKVMNGRTNGLLAFICMVFAVFLFMTTYLSIHFNN